RTHREPNRTHSEPRTEPIENRTKPNFLRTEANNSELEKIRLGSVLFAKGSVLLRLVGTKSLIDVKYS
ncbi:hypothetical protein BpHYR1_022730, partial [Brachionus plicatilis]